MKERKSDLIEFEELFEMLEIDSKNKEYFDLLKLKKDECFSLINKDKYQVER